MAKDTGAAEVAPAPPKVSKAPLMIMIVLAVVALGGVGAAGVMFMKMKKAQTAGADGKTPENEPSKENDNGEKPKSESGHGEAPKAGGGHGEKPKTDSSLGAMLKLEPFIVNLAPGSARKVCKLTLELEMKNSSAEEAAKERLAKVKDAIIMYVTTKSDIELTNDMNAIKTDIMQRLQPILGEGAVKGVYITEFLMP